MKTPLTAKKNWRTTGLGFLTFSLIALTLAGCGGASTPTVHHRPTNHAPVTQTPTMAPTPTPTPVSSQLLTAVNTMVNADNANLANFNSSSAATSAAGINATITDHTTFDTTLAAIFFPASKASLVNRVLSADAAYENELGDLAVNTDDVSNYNAIFDTVLPLQSTFQADLTTLTSDYGLSFSSSGS